MSLFLILGGYLLVAAVLMYILMFGESSTGCVGKLHRWITTVPCDLCGRFLTRCCSQQWIDRLDGVYEYCCWTPNPFMQMFFVGLVAAGYVIFWQNCWQYLGVAVTSAHKVGAVVALVIDTWLYCMACYSDPGEITEENVERYLKLYPHDSILFHPGKCPTTGLDKPARSKYCRISKKMYARYDHFCPWLNNCVAEQTARWFLFFLLFTATLCIYCAVVTFQILRYEVLKQRLLEAYIVVNGDYVPLSWSQIVQLLMHQNAWIVFLLMFTTILSIVVYAFAGHHLWLAATNYTTNERFKLSDLKMMIKANEKGEELNSYEQKLVDAAAKAGGISNKYSKGMLRNLGEVLFPNIMHERYLGAQELLAEAAAKAPHKSTKQTQSKKGQRQKKDS